MKISAPHQDHISQLFSIALDIFRRPSPSGQEDLMRTYVVKHLASYGFTVSVDFTGNVLAVRGIPASQEGYPLLSFHMDCVSYSPYRLSSTSPSAVAVSYPLPVNTSRGPATWQRSATPTLLPLNALIIEREWLHTHRQFVLGGDDKCGGSIALTLAATTDLPLKIVASVEEEMGCVGIEQVDPHFFEDVAYALVLDRRGADHLIVSIAGHLLCQGTFAAALMRAAAKTGLLVYAAEGALSDALTLSHFIPNVANLSVGYYHPHTVEERVSLFDLWQSYRWVLEALRHLPRAAPDPDTRAVQRKAMVETFLCSVCQKLAIAPTDLSGDLQVFICHCPKTSGSAVS